MLVLEGSEGFLPKPILYLLQIIGRNSRKLPRILSRSAVSLLLKMKHDVECQPASVEVGVYECEIHLKFRLIEEKSILNDRDKLLEMLIDAFACGTDEYMEPLQIEVEAHEVPEVQASPPMRRRLIRLRNSRDLT